MANDTKLFKAFGRHIHLTIACSAPARVVTVHDDFTADVQPLFKVSGDNGDLEDLPMILGAHILKAAKDIKAGDVVHLNFTDKALDNLVNNQTFDPEFTRTHSLNDAVIVGVYQL